MRFVALAFFVLVVPLVYVLLRRGPGQWHAIAILIGLLPFITEALHLEASIISWALWPGYVKGMIVSLLDAIAVGVLLAAPRHKIRTPFIPILLAYVAVVVLSVISAQVKQASFFYAWQLARMVLVFLAVSRIATRPKGALYVIYGLAISAIIQSVAALMERLSGATQAAGLMAHQNSLGMAIHFALYPCLALLLAGRRELLLKTGFVAAGICVVLTGSRATIGLDAIGIVAMLTLSLARKPTRRKSAVAAAGLLALLAAAPVAYVSLSKRLTGASIASSDTERAALKRAAWMIIADHPMGIGANEYVVTANAGGYSERAGVSWGGGSRTANVHNTYLLMIAELGYLGGGVYIVLMLLPVLMVLRFAWRDRSDSTGEIALGVAVVLSVIATHSLFEWIYVSGPVLYLHGIILGIAAGLMRRQRRQQMTERRGRYAALVRQPTA